MAYSIRQGFKNIRRNLLFSLASIGTIVSCLFLFGIFYCVIVNFRTAMTDLKNTVSISVFFDEGISQDNIALIGQQIRLREEINTMDFVSADEAWEQYARENYEDYEAAMEAFAGDNPLKNSASYKITLKDLDKQAEFVNYLKELKGVRKVLTSEVTADGIAALSSVVKKRRNCNYEADWSNQFLCQGAVHCRGCNDWIGWFIIATCISIFVI